MPRSTAAMASSRDIGAQVRAVNVRAGRGFGDGIQHMILDGAPEASAPSPTSSDHLTYGRRHGTSTHSSASSPHASSTPSNVTAMMPAYIEVKSKIW